MADKRGNVYITLLFTSSGETLNSVENSDGGAKLLNMQRLHEGTEHSQSLAVRPGSVSCLGLQIFPDGGISVIFTVENLDSGMLQCGGLSVTDSGSQLAIAGQLNPRPSRILWRQPAHY